MKKQSDQIIEQENELNIEQEPVTVPEIETEPEISAEAEIIAVPEPKPVIKAEKAKATVEYKPGNKRILSGTVVSNKADKTITVAVVRQVAHPLYKKYFKRTSKFMAHDEQNQCNIGDKVKVKESRPLSAHKRWELVEIIERAK